jgi:hypothetical protein
MGLGIDRRAPADGPLRDPTSRRGSGTDVAMKKILPARTSAARPARLEAIAAELARTAHEGALEEMQQQNQELLRALERAARARRTSCRT